MKVESMLHRFLIDTMPLVDNNLRMREFRYFILLLLCTAGVACVPDNICDFGASQGLMIEAVQNVTIRNNLFNGNGDKAIGLDIGSTGAKVSANIVGTGIGHEIGMDDTSKQGYQGPQPGGGP